MISARSYAKAYLDVTKSLDVVEQLGWLLAFEDRVVQRTLTRILELRDAAPVLEMLEVPAPIARFLTVVAQDQAIQRLSIIAEQAQLLAAEMNRGIAARLTSTTELTDEQREQLLAALQSAADAPVVMAIETDSRLLGGFRLVAGRVRVDQSLQSRVASLKRALVTA